MGEEINYYYVYINNGKELFTSNVDLAHKRADNGTSIIRLTEEDAEDMRRWARLAAEPRNDIHRFDAQRRVH